MDLKKLQEDVEKVDKALDTFNYSFKKCKRIGIKEKYTDEELDSFEAFISRFSRISYILLEKILKNIFLLLREDANTFIDKINLAEKLEIIPGAEQVKIIRDLRNEITHEYCMDDITELFKNVLEYSDALLKVVERVKMYVSDKILAPGD
ncbi:MAG: hypothetical protein MUF15_07060 [Acidobacteria bacterium]|jgi:hypothetical protein|nr:hypothetical protein [Acidobacteriota bacterium]